MTYQSAHAMLTLNNSLYQVMMLVSDIQALGNRMPMLSHQAVLWNEVRLIHAPYTESLPTLTTQYNANVYL